MMLEQKQNMSIMVTIESRIEALCKRYAWLKAALDASDSVSDFIRAVRIELANYYQNNPQAESFVNGGHSIENHVDILNWPDYAAVLLDHLIQNEGKKFFDPNMGKSFTNKPLRILWKALKGIDTIHEDLLTEFEMIFKQLYDEIEHTISYDDLENWMDRHPSGLDRTILKKRKQNRERIIDVIVGELMKGSRQSGRFQLPAGCTKEEAHAIVEDWWEESAFHLAFAVRSADLLQRMMGNTLDETTFTIMKEAEIKGLPIFVNPYYLSLLCVDTPAGQRQTDLAIRMYIFYSRSLVDEFGNISAWEKEDQVIIGEPNAAGWLLPSHNIHRRYPEVAILIPDTIGRACGGLCSSCQRMYGFQSGDFNFDLSKLSPKESWDDKLETLLDYYEKDTQLRDILITGGDALMSTNRSIKQILDRTLEMIERKVHANKGRTEKYAEITRIRLGTRLPVYLPQRVDDELIEILADFRSKAKYLGVKQFIIQTHFESAMEITPEAKTCISLLLSAGWYVTNQMVFTSAAAVRGHTAKLRSELNAIGVLPYYTFSVKGFKENSNNFATNARIVQEMKEEKVYGKIPDELHGIFNTFTEEPADLVYNLEQVKNDNNLPFLATDRSVINIPGVGKSLTFQVVGFCDDGRRIQEFTHDSNRAHSPAVDHSEVEVIIESKSVSQFLRELAEMGEPVEEYSSIYGYSLCETEARIPLYAYPLYDFPITSEISNFRQPN